jgi:hypothetical protein
VDKTCRQAGRWAGGWIDRYVAGRKVEIQMDQYAWGNRQIE